MHAFELTIRPFYLKTIHRVGSQIFDITTLKRNLKDFDLNYTDIKILNVAFSFLNDKEVPSFFLVIKTSALEYSHIVSFSLNSDKIILMGLSDNQYEMFEVVEGINFYFLNNFGLFSIKSSHLERIHYFKNQETGIYFFRHFCFEGPAVCLIVKRHNQFDMIVTVHLISENQFPFQRVFFNKTYSFDQPVDDVMVFRISPNLLNVVFSYKVPIKTSKVDNAWRLLYQNISIDYPGFTYSLQTSEKIRDYLNLKFTINKESSGSIKLKDPESESLSVNYLNDSRNLIEPETVYELNQLFSFQGPISSVRIGEDTNPDVTLQKVLNLTQSFVLEDSDCWVMQRMENGTFACLSRNYEVTLWDKESRILTSDIKELGDSKGFLSKICYESETQFIVIEKDLLLFFVCKVLEIETQEENASRIVYVNITEFTSGRQAQPIFLYNLSTPAQSYQTESEVSSIVKTYYMRYEASIRSLVVVARFYGEVLVLDFQKNDAGVLDYQGRNSMTFPLLVESSKQYNLLSSSYLLVNQSLLISMYGVDSTHRLHVGSY